MSAFVDVHQQTQHVHNNLKHFKITKIIRTTLDLIRIQVKKRISKI